MVDTTQPGRFAYEESGQCLRPVSLDDPRAVLAWNPARGWQSLLPPEDSRRDLLELYLPICSAHGEHPITVGHLGQSLDGFIATPSGDSHYVTGSENILHLHRMRALCDAVIVGAGTVAADDPRLTTRLVAGKNPLRVVIDPICRLGPQHRVFSDGEAPTLRACAAGSASSALNGSTGQWGILEVRRRDDGLDLGDLLRQLHARGCARIFVEGGGVTVSSFFEAGLLDRMHVAVAALFIGEGRPALRLSAPARLKDCPRPTPRIYRMGTDILFDCDLRADTARGIPSPQVRRIL